ncbi:ABC transporter ATP-binding protein [Paenibacillus yanchengensis]|uniref:ABC transporter ATP-binding protein n=1 Tax=Paenibacillus yanchengensis TaxID=2035833 RepID=A0ABW4YKE5_9BACL
MNIVEMKDIIWDREEKTVLKNVNWTIKKGEHWCLLGLNGSGKTTMLNMINGYIWPTSGSVSVLGHRFGEYDLRELRKRIGWVSTSLHERLYYNDNALSIVLSGKFASIGVYDEIQEADENKAITILKQLGCEQLIARKYGTFSQGEKQRVLIARALMNDPELLILDEPCTGLDLFAREQVLAMIEQLATIEEAPTLIYVTHHVEEILPCFNKTLLVKDGMVFAEGNTSQILNSHTLSQFFEVPVHIEQRSRRNWLEVVN